MLHIAFSLAWMVDSVGGQLVTQRVRPHDGVTVAAPVREPARQAAPAVNGCGLTSSCFWVRQVCHPECHGAWCRQPNRRCVLSIGLPGSSPRMHAYAQQMRTR